MKKLLFALTLAALALVSCNGKDDINGGDYATVTMGGQTWTKAEIITYSHFILNFEGTDVDGNQFVVKGKATKQ